MKTRRLLAILFISVFTFLMAVSACSSDEAGQGAAGDGAAPGGDSGPIVDTGAIEDAGADAWTGDVGTDAGIVPDTGEDAGESPDTSAVDASADSYLSTKNGAPSVAETVADMTAPFSLSPDYDLAVDNAGNVHAVYSKPGSSDFNNVLYRRKRTAAGWDAEKGLTALDRDVWSPAIGLDGAGVVHLAYADGADWDHKTLTYNRLEAGAWKGVQAISTSTDDRTYYLGVAGDPVAGVHIAFKRFFDSMSDVLYIRGNGGAFETEEIVTATPDMDEDTPSLTVTSSGLPQIVFTENLKDAPNGKVYLATKRR
ncbi:MAG: hypothetical protein HY897_24580 [Deltaproteobacteria bacterium]|nr:hypothetical protein [Deltaproteobacteria bacterium]